MSYYAYEKPDLKDIAHYGVKGMKWGVRHYKESKKQVDSIVKSMSKKDRELLGIYDGKYGISKGEHFLNRQIKKVGKTPVAFFDITMGSNYINAAVGTRGEKKYRGKGYAKAATKSGMDWWEKNKDKYKDKNFNWWVRRENIASIKLAEANGFTLNKSDLEKWKDWYHYEYKRK